MNALSTTLGSPHSFHNVSTTVEAGEGELLLQLNRGAYPSAKSRCVILGMLAVTPSLLPHLRYRTVAIERSIDF